MSKENQDMNQSILVPESIIKPKPLSSPTSPYLDVPRQTPADARLVSDTWDMIIHVDYDIYRRIYRFLPWQRDIALRYIQTFRTL